MNEHHEIIPVPDFDSQRDIIVKWVNVLLICQIANVVTTVLGAFSAVSTLAGWAARIVGIAAAAALFGLAPVHERYRKAAIFHAVTVGGGIVSALLKVELFGLALSVCSIVAAYQELNAHSELTAPKDGKLSRRWHSLFYWEIVVGLLAGFASTVTIMIAAFAEMAQDAIVSLVVAITAVISAVIALIRVLYLKQTLALYQE